MQDSFALPLEIGIRVSDLGKSCGQQGGPTNKRATSGRLVAPGLSRGAGENGGLVPRLRQLRLFHVLCRGIQVHAARAECTRRIARDCLTECTLDIARLDLRG